MEILLWLVPPVVVTVLAAVAVSWYGRESRGEIDRDEAVARLGRALDVEQRAGYAARPAPEDRSSGVALRRSTPSTPAEPEQQEPPAVRIVTPREVPADQPSDQPARRAAS